MKNKILWIFTLLPTFITLIAIQFMGDEIPAHSDAMGNIDRWGSKYESFILPIIIIVVTLFWTLFLRSFKNKQVSSSDDKVVKEAALNERVIYYIAIGMVLIFTITHCASMWSSIVASKVDITTMVIDINLITNIVLGIFLIFIGNVMPKCKRNSVIGLRTIWSMKNDISWSKSNRFGGVSLIISGVLIIIETALIGGILSTFIMLGIILIDGIISVIYSYYAYNQSVMK